MKIKCEACGRFVRKEFITKTENIYCKSDYDEVNVCNKCLGLKHSMNLDFQRELHKEWRRLAKEKKENEKKNKKEDA